MHFGLAINRIGDQSIARIENGNSGFIARCFDSKNAHVAPPSDLHFATFTGTLAAPFLS
jgi:hypothetical protein